MAKMTKTQKKNALKAIRMKAFNLVKFDAMSMVDYAAIRKITMKNENKLK